MSAGVVEAPASVDTARHPALSAAATISTVKAVLGAIERACPMPTPPSANQQTTVRVIVPGFINEKYKSRVRDGMSRIVMAKGVSFLVFGRFMKSKAMDQSGPRRLRHWSGGLIA